MVLVVSAANLRLAIPQIHLCTLSGTFILFAKLLQNTWALLQKKDHLSDQQARCEFFNSTAQSVCDRQKSSICDRQKSMKNKQASSTLLEHTFRRNTLHCHQQQTARSKKCSKKCHLDTDYQLCTCARSSLTELIRSF